MNPILLIIAAFIGYELLVKKPAATTTTSNPTGGGSTGTGGGSTGTGGGSTGTGGGSGTTTTNPSIDPAYNVTYEYEQERLYSWLDDPNTAQNYNIDTQSIVDAIITMSSSEIHYTYEYVFYYLLPNYSEAGAADYAAMKAVFRKYGIFNDVFWNYYG